MVFDGIVVCTRLKQISQVVQGSSRAYIESPLLAKFVTEMPDYVRLVRTGGTRQAGYFRETRKDDRVRIDRSRHGLREGLARSPAVALLFDEESNQGCGHYNNADERQNSRGTEYAEEKEKTTDKHE